ncbi:hypothetical protein BXT86_05425 [candidate division WOR-3 bacterium 4484_100]|uniref:DUF1343 domain-containing protein n=1 Tax=candidate division WOR-3 bacterium 4484_100 TaxID=1936077 RepID=A0A1V4QE81_UNCW3|nr:MAG: hypothetical protein BXT86_05425 [candidate division WOR-3 bacterium 4484_100]
MELGIDRLISERFKILRGKRIGLLANFSSCNKELKPTIDIFLNQRYCKLNVIFAPEHGLFSALQDQKRAFDFIDSTRGVLVSSLYGRRLAPDQKVLDDIDSVVIDLIDIGTRYYTFLWSAMLLIKECAKSKKTVYILDRPNPLNGVTVQGPVLERKFSSFVGLYPIPVRHGMTIGEVCNLINREYAINADLRIIPISGWKRKYYFPQTGLRWVPPSPNMPSFDTTLVYPGMCLLEGTNISEGRGTTRPFETFGAPYIEPERLCSALKKERIKGVIFRPTSFIPTFSKYRGRLCGGAQVYVQNGKVFNPILLGLAVIKTIRNLYPKEFQWRKPPYEFEKKKLPFDILIGNSWVRRMLMKDEPLWKIEKRWSCGFSHFKKLRKKYLIYD